MAARLTVLLPRLLALVVIWLLGWSTYTLAAGTPASEPQTTTVPAEPAKAPKFLTVPDTRTKAYVFAKGILQDAGFAWRIDGSVQGYAANEVVGQKPAPGTRVLDNGEPVVALVLERNSKYGERGLPENESPYGGEKIVLASQYWKQQAANKKKEPEQPEQPTSTAPAPEPAPAPAPEPTVEPAPEPEPTSAEQRKPDFIVPGAPPEPADEMPLPARALQLETYLQGKRPTDEVVNHWLYQHSWIVTGALFGWQDGAQALRILIRVDESLQRRWDIGARSEARARRALAEVNRHLQ